MPTTLTLILLTILFLAIGIALGFFISNIKQKAGLSSLEERLRSQAENENKLQGRINELEQEREAIRAEKDQLALELTRRNADFDNLKQRNDEQKSEVEKLQERFQKEFENLANKILDEKSTKFTTQNKENIDAILKPLQEKYSILKNGWKKPTKKTLTAPQTYVSRSLG